MSDIDYDNVLSWMGIGVRTCHVHGLRFHYANTCLHCEFPEIFEGDAQLTLEECPICLIDTILFTFHIGGACTRCLIQEKNRA